MDHPDAECCDHIAQIYEVDSALFTALEGYTLEGFAAEEVVVIIAKPDHIAQLESALGRHAPLVTAAREAGLFQTMDVNASMAELMEGDWPSAQRFSRVLDSILALGETRSGRRRVRIFGEIAPLLWEAGQVEAALQLERICHDECLRRGFQLLCSYSIKAFRDNAATGVRRVCSMHTRVISGRMSTL